MSVYAHSRCAICLLKAVCSNSHKQKSFDASSVVTLPPVLTLPNAQPRALALHRGHTAAVPARLWGNTAEDPEQLPASINSTLMLEAGKINDSGLASLPNTYSSG